jgi:MFS family permease
MPRVSAATRWQLLRGIVSEGHLLVLFAVVGLWAACDVALFLATSVVALDAGGAHAVGLVGAVRVLPGALCIGFVGVLADRVSRSLLVAGVNLVLAAICLGMAAAVSAGGGLAVLVLLLGVGSVASAFVKPSLHSLLPRLVPLPSQLVQAGAAWNLMNGVGCVLGPALGAALLAVRGADTLYVALAVAYAGTALTAAAIRTPYQPARERTVARRRAGWWGSPLRGVGLFASRGSRTMFSLSLLQQALAGLVGAALVLYAFEVAGPDGERVSGHLLAAVGAGGLLGSVVTLGADGRHTRWWFAAGVLLYGLPLAVLGVTTELGVATLAVAVCGAGGAWAGIYGSGLITRLLPDHVAGRGWGVLLGIGAGGTALGSLAAPALARLIGLTQTLVLVGVLTALLVAAAVPGLHALAGRTVPPADVLAVFKRVGMLAPLPGICLERLAVAAGRRQVAPGEPVVREGEPGQEFFVVEDGELVVSIEGREVRRLGRDDAFGEVALLRTVARTATVVAARPTVLLTLGQDDFVATVTGHRPTESWAEGAVADLLTEDARRMTL